MTDKQAGSPENRLGTQRLSDFGGGLLRVILSAAAAGMLVTALACTATARPGRAAATLPASVPAAGSSAAPAAAPTTKHAPAHGPSLTVAGGTIYDFGKVWPTKDNLKHTFKLTNTGDAALKILHVQPG